MGRLLEKVMTVNRKFYNMQTTACLPGVDEA